MSEPVVLHEVLEGGIHRLTIHRPAALNALNAQVLTELAEAVDRIGRDENARAVVIHGSGEKAFVAGADIASMLPLTPEQAEQFAGAGQRTLDRLAALPVPVIAAVQGFALGGGCELAMACDIVLAGVKAKFGQPEVNLGVIPGFGGTQRLVRRVGPAKALDLCLSARVIDADEAVLIGLASRKVEGDVLEAALTLAREIASKGPVAVALCKKAIHDYADGELSVGLAGERALFGKCFATSDQKEGMTAFLEKRKSNFTGR